MYKFYRLIPSIIVIFWSLNTFAFNSESVTFFEKPVAYQTQYGVIELNALFDIGQRSDNNSSSKYSHYEAGSSISYQTQLANDWDIGFLYLADYQNQRNDSYQDLFRLFIQDQWGEVQLGDISSLIYERTNRQITTGLLGADNDEFTLSLESSGVFYQWQTPSTQLMLSADKEANFELGVRLYKPINGIEYVFSARANHVDNDRADAQGVSQSDSFAIVAQAQRGRWVVDSQYMQEKLAFLASRDSFTLDTFSAGIHYQANRWGWSVSGILRENELNDSERFLSLGLRYNYARGLSINAGKSISYSKLLPERLHSYALSLRYEF